MSRGRLRSANDVGEVAVIDRVVLPWMTCALRLFAERLRISALLRRRQSKRIATSRDIQEISSSAPSGHRAFSLRCEQGERPTAPKGKTMSRTSSSTHDVVVDARMKTSCTRSSATTIEPVITNATRRRRRYSATYNASKVAVGDSVARITPHYTHGEAKTVTPLQQSVSRIARTGEP